MARVLPFPSNISKLTLFVMVIFDLLEELFTDFYAISILFKRPHLLLLCLLNQLFSLPWIFSLVDCPKVISRRKIGFIIIWEIKLKVWIFFHYLSVDLSDMKAFVVRNWLSIGMLIWNSLWWYELTLLSKQSISFINFKGHRCILGSNSLPLFNQTYKLESRCCTYLLEYLSWIQVR